MTLPRDAYADPAVIVEQSDLYRMRERRGCWVCAHRRHNDETTAIVCAAGQERRRGKAYCDRWEMMSEEG